MFSQFHVQYKVALNPLDVTEIRVAPYQPVSITTSKPINDSPFKAGDVVVLQGIPVGGPTYLNDMQFIVNWTSTYTVYLYDLYNLNGSTLKSYSIPILTGTKLHHGIYNATGGTCHKWYKNNLRIETTCLVANLIPNTWFKFRIREICTDSDATSDYSKWSDEVKTLASYALPPYDLNIDPNSVTRTSQVVRWTPDDSSCETSGDTFVTWVVEYQEADQLRGEYMGPHIVVPWKLAEEHVPAERPRII